jgi:hypothetical protein
MNMDDQNQQSSAAFPHPFPPRPRGSIGTKIAGGVLAALMLAVGACSFIVENKTDQCQSDADCEHFGSHPFCREGICVESGLGPPGCFYGDAVTSEQFQNQCTTAECLKFDNCARLHLCEGDALPALVDPPKLP